MEAADKGGKGGFSASFRIREPACLAIVEGEFALSSA
jgi:hypothetical protein